LYTSRFSSSIFSTVSCDIVVVFPHRQLYSSTEIEMFCQLDMVRHPEVGLGLLLVTVVRVVQMVMLVLVSTVTVFVVGVGIPLVVVFADL
jgi:hypothetical protein